MNKKKLITVDFDNTICIHDFPKIGEPLPLAFEVMKELQIAGHRLILWTCREGETLQSAIDFCKENGVEFVSHNTNTKEDAYIWPSSRKVLADIYIDDRNLGGFPGWEVVRKTILG